MKRKQEPHNFPTLECIVCKNSCEPYKKYICNNDGTIVHAHTDPWPEYFRDIENTRVEFCSAQCGLEYCTKNQLV
jgi:hypothetical protein